MPQYLFHEVQLQIHLIQGYRFLDHCGEALVRLEDVLDKGWITTESAPKGGAIRNDAVGMGVHFNSEILAVQQSDYFDLSMFRDQANKTYSVVRETCKIERINLPTVRVLLQKGFEDLEVANEFLVSLNLCSVASETLEMIGGKRKALEFVLVTNDEPEWSGELVRQRRRLAANVLRQEKRQSFDERLLRRARTLPERQADAIAVLLKLRKQMPDIPPVAVQIDIENSFEQEFSAKSFDLPTFIDEGWEWAISVQTAIEKFKPRS